MNQRIYFSASSYFKEKYGKKFKRLPIDAGFSCPGRCIYCSSTGSLAYNSSAILKSNFSREDKSLAKRYLYRFTIEQRMELIKNQIEKLYKRDGKTLLYLYFQSFSNTFDSIKNMKKIYDYSLNLAKFDGVFIGTRPDCIDLEKTKFLSNYSKNYDLWIELGLQSSNEKTLQFINRKHTASDFEFAANLLKSYGIKIIAHIIIGLNDEKTEDLIETIKFLNKTGIDGIKFHNLYILPNTEIVKYYEKGIQKVLSEEEYISLLAKAISYLKNDIIVFRLFSDPEEGFIAPKWKSNKLQLINKFEEFCKKNYIYQGKLWKD
ncbi:MAG: TIGR01212 family radical SAM protein [Exilispira sp.]